MVRNIDGVFTRQHFFRAERNRLNKSWRQIIREVLLPEPWISEEELRRRVISRAQLTPLDQVRLGRVEAAIARRVHAHPDMPHQDYRNLVWLSFKGNGRLFAAWGSGRPLIYRAAVLDDTSAALVYFADHNDRGKLANRAAADLPLIEAEVEWQRARTERHNQWVIKAVDQMLAWYGDHIALWREEGRLDWSKRRAA